MRGFCLNSMLVQHQTEDCDDEEDYDDNGDDYEEEDAPRLKPKTPRRMES